MREKRRATQSDFVKLLRRKRGKKRVPMRELAFEIDRRLYLLARARALFTRAMAQGLFLLSQGGGLAQLGYRNIGDFVTERLGMSVRQAQQLRAVAEGLQSLPHVDAAWARGDLKYCVVRLLVGKIPAIEDELWATVGQRKTENQVRELLRAWEDAKARGEAGDQWGAYVERVKAGGSTQGATAGDAAGSQPGAASGSRGEGDVPGDTVDSHRGEGPEAGGVDEGEAGTGDDPLSQGDGDRGERIPDRSPESEEDAESRGCWMQFRVNPDVATKWYVALEIVRRQAGHDVAAASMLEAAMAEFMTEKGFEALAQAEAEEAAARATTEEMAETACRVALAVASAAGLVPPGVRGLSGATSERAVSVIRGAQWEKDREDDHDDPSESEANWRRIEDDLAEFNQHWAHLSWSVPPLRLPARLEWTPGELSPREIDTRLRALMRLNQRNDFHLMDLLIDLYVAGLFVDLEFTSVAHYVQERLGLSATWCKAGIRLAWTLRRNPTVARALREGRLNQGQARLLCRVARDPWIKKWIEHARTTTVRFLKEDVEAAERLHEEDCDTFDRTGGLPQARPVPLVPPTRERTGARKANQEGTTDDIARQGELLSRMLEEIAAHQEQRSPGAETAPGGPSPLAGGNLGAILADIVADSAAAREMAGPAEYNEGQGHFRAPGAGPASEPTDGAPSAEGHFRAPSAGPASEPTDGTPSAEGHSRAPAAGPVSEPMVGTPSAEGHSRAPAAGLASDATAGSPCAHGHSHAPTPLVPPGLSFKQQLKHLVHAYASGKCTTEFWSKSLVRLRFWLPETQKAAWEEVRLAVSILSGSRRQTAFVDEVIEHLLDAFLREWAATALEEIKKHPILEAGGWKCSVPTCTNRACLEDHHIRFLSRGGSNHPSNRAPLCWFHHHNGVHAGHIILEGTVPGGLRWRIGVDDQGDHLIVWDRQIVEPVPHAA